VAPVETSVALVILACGLDLLLLAFLCTLQGKPQGRWNVDLDGAWRGSALGKKRGSFGRNIPP